MDRPLFPGREGRDGHGGMEAAAMDFLRRTLATIQKQLGPLSATHKLLVGTVLIVLLMTLFIVSQYAGKQSVEEVLPGATPAQLDAAAAQLEAAGITTKREGNKLMVESGMRGRAISALGERGMLPNDKAIMFENILSKSNWMNSRQQNEQTYINALANELAARIGDFRGVKSAAVFLDIPEPTGFGAQLRKPSASVTVTTDSGQALPQAMVDAVAGFVAGSRSGLTIDRVSIIDAASGRQRKATSEEEALPATFMEHASFVEAQTREKLLGLLSYIPGVTVAVTAHVDVTRSRAEVRTNMPEKQGTISMRRKETETVDSSTQAGPGAEPGFGANQTADINRGPVAASGNKSDTSSTTTEYENHVGTRTETIIDPKGHATRVAISVVVPQGYVARLVQAAKGGADGAAQADKAVPSDEELGQRFAVEKKRIIDSISPHVKAMIAKADETMTEETLRLIVTDSIDVAMVPVDVPPGLEVSAAGMFGGLRSSGGGGGGGIGEFIGGGLFDKAVLALLSVAALFMMAMMVRKVSIRREMPTAEELVGLPQTLETETDLVGEAEEVEAALAGIEVGEQEMQDKKILEQVEALVETEPESSAKLLARWVEMQS
ncbi:MAG: flagellar M-ring protein FliF C-terminal domain-containing protein [Phycisphaerales bacterium]|jgi:flagellar biosynthesis/type III secretory pathway M-ring protein FliF/YscJ